jgi:hypothetical protein
MCSACARTFLEKKWVAPAAAARPLLACSARDGAARAEHRVSLLCRGAHAADAPPLLPPTAPLGCCSHTECPYCRVTLGNIYLMDQQVTLRVK